MVKNYVWFFIFNQLYIVQLYEIIDVPYKRSLTDNTTQIFQYKRNWEGCQQIDSNGEECKFYGECCGDPVRIRERLEPESYQCMNIGNTQGKQNGIHRASAIFFEVLI